MVSWKEAADSHDSVASDALVMPIRTGRPEAGVPPSATHSRLIALELGRSTSSPGSMSASPDSMHVHALEHLPHDDLDVLVVDRHTLRAVDLLHLLDEVELDRHAGRGCAAPRCGLRAPAMSWWPTSMCSPSVTCSRDRLETG